MFSDARSKYDVAHLSQSNNATDINKALTSEGHSDFDATAKNIQLAFKLKAIKLETEKKLWVVLAQKEGTKTAMTSTIVVLKTRIGSLESKNWLFLQTNEEVSPHSLQSQKILSAARKSSADIVPNKFI